jgi:hypothetical protein
MQLRRVEHLGELPGVHRRGADVQRLAGFDHVAERIQGLLDGGVAIETVDLVEHAGHSRFTQKRSY